MRFDPRDPDLARKIDEYWDAQGDSDGLSVQPEAEPHEIIGDIEAQNRAMRERRKRREGAAEHNRQRREEAAAEEAEQQGVQITPELKRQLMGEQSGGGMTEFERELLGLMREQNQLLEGLGTLP